MLRCVLYARYSSDTGRRREAEIRGDPIAEHTRPEATDCTRVAAGRAVNGPDIHRVWTALEHRADLPWARVDWVVVTQCRRRGRWTLQEIRTTPRSTLALVWGCGSLDQRLVRHLPKRPRSTPRGAVGLPIRARARRAPDPGAAQHAVAETRRLVASTSAVPKGRHLPSARSWPPAARSTWSAHRPWPSGRPISRAQ